MCDREGPVPTLEQFENIERLLAEALSLDESRRRSFLREQTSDSTAADLIESLIESCLEEGDSDVIRTGGALAGQFGRSLLERFGEVDEPNLLAPDTKIGTLCIKRLVGSGGMGAVYAAFDEKLERWVAVKTLRAQKGVGTRAKDRFLREARSLARFDHPGICRIYDFVEQGDERYLILELIHGVSLGQFASEGLSTKECLRVVKEIAEALVVAHGVGIVHRDLKPDNVMIEKKGKVRLTDFGIALWQGEPQQELRGNVETSTGEVDDHDGALGAGSGSSAGASGEENELLTCSGSIVGTLRYMSPEQARGEPATVASDLYALGLLLQELITGEPAYEATATRMELLPVVAVGACRPPDQVTDAELRTLILDATALDPAARPTAEDFVRRITSILARPERRRRRLRWAMAVLMVIVAAAVTFSLSKPRPLLESGQRGRIILLPLENATGDPDLDWIEEGLTRMVAETLDATQGIEIVPRDRVAVALGNETVPIDPESLVALDRALGAELAVMAKMTGGAGNIEVEYTTVSISGSVGRKSFRSGEIIEAGRSLGTRLARRLRPDSMPQDLVDTFSDSPFLNRLYAMGVDHLERGDPMRAGPYFKVCLDRDEVFGWAALKLATVEEKMGRGEEGVVQARRALDVAERRGDVRLAAFARIELSTLAA
ncbi:MAG: serine/threonine protein kinase, partial [Actinomycetia bacterium]|nr:serine/threonine protein kinase [Actinomycetes bacterium]